VFVISGTKANLLPTVPFVESDGCGIWRSDFEINSSLCFSAQSFQKGGSDAAPLERRVDGEVENLGFAGSGLPPGTEAGECGIHQGHQQGKARIIAQRPLGRFRTPLLNAGHSRKIAFAPGADEDNRYGVAQSSLSRGFGAEPKRH